MAGKAGQRKIRVESALRSVPPARLALSAAWKDSLYAFLGGRFLYSLIGLIIWASKYRPPYADQYYYDIAPVLDGPMGALFGVWQRWDGIHYLRIAAYGYTNDHVSLFYPLYPLLGRWLSQITRIEPLVTMQVVSSAALLLSMVLLHKIVSRHFSVETARMTLLALVVFPSSYYFYAIFPQSLLLLLFLLAYTFILRGWWVGAAAAGVLAGLTHSTGVVLSILVGIEALQFLWPRVTALRQGRFTLDWNLPFALLAPFSPLLGFAAFMAWRESAGFLPYVALQSEKYARALTMPWEGVAAIVRFMISPEIPVNGFVAWINNACFLLMVFLTIRYFRRIPWSWWFLQTGFLVFLTTNFTTGYPLIGFFRYSLVIFPLFPEIALSGQKPGWRLAKFALGLLLAIFYSAMFFMWQYDLS